MKYTDIHGETAEHIIRESGILRTRSPCHRPDCEKMLDMTRRVMPLDYGRDEIRPLHLSNPKKTAGYLRETAETALTKLLRTDTNKFG